MLRNTAEELEHGRRPAVHGWLSVLMPFERWCYLGEAGEQHCPSQQAGAPGTYWISWGVAVKTVQGTGKFPPPVITAISKGNSSDLCMLLCISHLLIRGKWQQTISMIYIFLKKPTKKNDPKLMCNWSFNLMSLSLFSVYYKLIFLRSKLPSLLISANLWDKRG